MKKIQDIAFIIQARAASQRIPQKMIKDFTGGGTSLFDIAIQKALELDIPKENLIVSIYDDRLKKIARGYDVRIYHRSYRSEMSEGQNMKELYEWWDYYPKFKYAILLNPCVPFISSKTIMDFIKTYQKTSSDGMFGVIQKKDYAWDGNGKFLTEPPVGVMNTKHAKPLLLPAHTLYAGKMEKIGQGIWMGDFNKPGDIELYPLHEGEVFDIDHPWQFQLASAYWKSLNEGE